MSASQSILRWRGSKREPINPKTGAFVGIVEPIERRDLAQFREALLEPNGSLHETWRRVGGHRSDEDQRPVT